MWFRAFIASWSFIFLALLGWMISHKSAEPVILGRYSSAYFTLLMTIAVLAVMSILAQAAFVYMRIYKARWEIMLLLSSLLFSLITVEIAIRIFDPLGISYFERVSEHNKNRIYDPVLIFKYPPNFKGIYNELGLRDRKLEKKQKGELRILLLGDSVTFGAGIPVEATFGRKLETILASRLGRPVRTVNTGIGGYNTVQEYASLRTYGDPIEPDVVILLYVRNDIEINNPPSDPWKTPSMGIKALLGKSWLYRLVGFVLKYSRPEIPETLNKNARGVKESMDALIGIATFCRERGITFVTFFYQPRVNDELLSKVQKIGNENGFHVRDTGSWWGNIDMRLIRNSIVDSHPNERGHEVLATGMADFLISHNLVRKTGADSDLTWSIFE
jgi:hypothetical protein